MWYLNWDRIESLFVPILGYNIVPKCQIPNQSQTQSQLCPILEHIHVPNLSQWDIVAGEFSNNHTLINHSHQLIKPISTPITTPVCIVASEYIYIIYAMRVSEWLISLNTVRYLVDSLPYDCLWSHSIKNALYVCIEIRTIMGKIWGKYVLWLCDWDYHGKMLGQSFHVIGTIYNGINVRKLCPDIGTKMGRM